MKTKTRGITAVAGALLLAAGLVSSVQAAPGHAAPRGGGGARGYAPPHGGGGGARGYAPGHGAPSRGQPPGRGTAHGTPHWGYGYGHGHYGYGGYYPYWGYGYGYPYWGWGVGFYWGWPGYYGYGPGYPYAYDGGYDDNYTAKVGQHPSSEPATIVTEIEPSQAEVLLDGESVGFASDYNGRWDTLRIAPGKHTIEFRKTGRRSLAIEIDARPGAKYTVKDTLEAGNGEDHRTLAEPSTAAVPDPGAPPAAAPYDGQPPEAGGGKATGRLRLHVDPADAAVYLDGQYLGLGGELTHIHGALAIASGKHRLEAVRPGYVTAVRDIEVGESDLAVTDVILQQQQ
jgi:hypothetical protein